MGLTLPFLCFPGKVYFRPQMPIIRKKHSPAVEDEERIRLKATAKALEAGERLEPE
jgi:hypothetical protein